MPALILINPNLCSTINTIFNISNNLANSTDWPNWYEGNEFKAIRDSQRSN